MLETIRRALRRLTVLLHRAEREGAMEDEMRFHIEMEAADLARKGVPPQEATRRARLAFGGIERFKEQGRDARGTRLFEDLWQDVGYALRQLRASPGFTAATVLTLALGIGAATMMNSVRRFAPTQATTLEATDELVYIGQGREGCPRCIGMAPGNFLTIAERARSFLGVTLFEDWEPVLRGSETSDLMDGARVTEAFFRTLVIPPMLGRALGPDDAGADAPRAVLLSETLWRARFGADSTVLGSTLILDREPYTVVGVVSDRSTFPRDAQLWTALVLGSAAAGDLEATRFRMVGRLRPGVSVTEARQELAGLGSQVASAEPQTMEGTTFLATPLMAPAARTGEVAFTIFDAAVALVLVISCINLAGLLIARLTARRRELAVRRGLGAAPSRIARQLLVETLVLTGLGGICAVLVATLGIRFVDYQGVPLDVEGFAFALGMALACGLLIGLWPALRFARPGLAGELRDGGRGETGGIDRARGRRALVVAQVALSIVLLSAAGLLTRSYLRVHGIDPGFSGAERMIALRLNSPLLAGEQPDPEAIAQLVEALAAVPGVEAASAALAVPFGMGVSDGEFRVAGREAASAEGDPSARMQASAPGYFATLGIPVVSGRDFSSGDTHDAPSVAIVNRAFMERFLSDENPLAHSVLIDGVESQIVGVVGTVFNGDQENLEEPEIYRPIAQWTPSSFWTPVLTRGNPELMGSALSDAVRRFDPDIAVTRLMTFATLRTTSMSAERRMLRSMAGYALAAILISAIGLYGVISYSVSQRTREFGVRLALGAQRRTVLGLVLGQGLTLAALGAAAGIVCALLALRVMRSLLFGITPSDPVTLLAVVASISGVALLAAYLPARRAMRVDPIQSLRED
jgi:putative ABC transport system permease protein